MSNVNGCQGEIFSRGHYYWKRVVLVLPNMWAGGCLTDFLDLCTRFSSQDGICSARTSRMFSPKL